MLKYLKVKFSYYYSARNLGDVDVKGKYGKAKYDDTDDQCSQVGGFF
jgi:hypothetical protein